MQPPNEGIPNFVARAQEGIASAVSSERFYDTRHNRIRRRYSLREVSELLGFHRSFISRWMDQDEAPKGVVRGRENTLSLYDILKLRGLTSARNKGRRPTLFWRTPDQPLPVITFSSQKGGVAKSLSAAHLAQYASAFFGLRVGLIDADPQATLSLYFADEDTDVAGEDTNTFTRFMGVPSPGDPPLDHSDADLDSFWVKTPWPGIRLIPGGAPIQEADISMYFMSQQDKDGKKRRIYRLLKDAIDRWSIAHPPRTRPEDLFTENGTFRDDAFQSALNETFDLIIIDCAPSLTLSQLNAVVAGTTLIVPNTLRGFDLSTLRVYLRSLDDYMAWIQTQDDPIDYPPVPSYILPTNVQTSNDTDVSQVGELWHNDPDVICPVYYAHSAAVATAAREYQSIYEYLPKRNRRKSADAFTANANAVGDAILTRAVPWLPSRGFANRFIEERFGGVVPPWTDEDTNEEDVA